MLSTVGGVFEPHWVANARLKPGSPWTIELLPHHNLLAPLGAWSLGKTNRQVAAPGKQQRNKKSPAKQLATWNVRTMCPSLSDDLQQIHDARKTAIIDRELSKLKVDIAALQETRLPASGSLKEKDTPYSGRDSTPSQETTRILSLRLSTPSGPANNFSVYAPTLYATAEAKDAFYEELEAKIREIPQKEDLFLLGDFNARVGSDHNSWPRCIGHFGVGKLNENGQRLLELCTFHGLCITNTFFSTKPHYRVSWRYPRSKHWHQLDFVITRSLLNRIVVISPTSEFANVTFANVLGRFANAMSRFANVLLVTSPTPNI